MFTLSPTEYEILSLLWASERGLTAAEINTLSPEKSWKDISIHIIINNMLSKGAIKVDGMARSGRVYSRTFTAAVTPEEYSLMQVQKNAACSKDASAVYTGLFCALVDSDSISGNDIEKIEEMIQQKKKERQE
ncbi:BlaI/MecI/CopY family transcriptional regulator [Oscillibacter sp.]|uniref:BlaI/MecI/CopY family transcriptional regulator n=1 Tax=Oscillibacter sp. TaxID=1945593 RepID=UPI002899B26F|nr:BlaI/MecI/CopY family transcriptional regulator [Oscillibacter sp.]